MEIWAVVININIIMKFLIGHKAFVSLYTTLPYNNFYRKILNTTKI